MIKCIPSSFRRYTTIKSTKVEQEAVTIEEVADEDEMEEEEEVSEEELSAILPNVRSRSRKPILDKTSCWH